MAKKSVSCSSPQVIRKVSKPAPKNTCMLDKDQRSQQRPSKNAPDDCFPHCWQPVAVVPVPLSMPRKPKLVVCKVQDQYQSRLEMGSLIFFVSLLSFIAALWSMHPPRNSRNTTKATSRAKSWQTGLWLPGRAYGGDAQECRNCLLQWESLGQDWYSKVYQSSGLTTSI